MFFRNHTSLPATNRITVVITLLLVVSGFGCFVRAQSISSWQTAADSSNRYFAQANYAKAYEFGLMMVKEAETLRAQNPQDTTLVTSLVRIGIAQRLSPKPDTAVALAAATRALSLLKPALKGTLLEAKVYSLNAIFNYAVGQSEKALIYAETATSQLEKLGLTRSSPYWEAQRYRVLMYVARKDSVSATKAAMILRQLLPVTARLFGEKDSRYAGLLAMWTKTFRLRSTPKSESDSVWSAIADLEQKRQDPLSLGMLRDAWEYFNASSNYEKTVELGRKMITEAERRYGADPAQDTTLIKTQYSVASRHHQLSTNLNPEATQYFERAFALLKPEYELKPWYVELYAASSRFLADIGEYKAAEERSQKTIDLCAKANLSGSVTCIQAQMTLASIYAVSRDKNKLAAAQRILETLLPVIDRIDDKNESKAQVNLMALGMLGTVYTMSIPLNDSTQHKADDLWETLIPLTRRVGDPLQLCRMLTGAGEYYMAINRMDSARRSLQESALIGKKFSNLIYYYIALSNLSTVETATGHYPEAVRVSEEILAAPETRQLPQIHLSVMANAVDGNIQLGKLDRAETLAKQALKLAENLYSTHTNYFYAVSLGMLGMVHYQRSDLSNAIHSFEEALDLLEKTARSDDPVLARFRSVMGDIYSSIDKEKALYNYQKARRAIELQPNYQQNDDHLHVLQSQMTTLRQLGRYGIAAQLADSVIQFYSQVSLSDRNALPQFLSEAYYTYHRVGRLMAADSVIQKLTESLARDTLAAAAKVSILRTVGSAHKFNGRYREAIQNLAESIRVGKTLHGNSNNLNAYVPVQIAACYLNLGNRAEATRLLRESLVRLRTNVAQNLWYMSENQREVYLEPYILPEIYSMAFQHPNPTPDELGLAYDYRLLIQGLLLNTSQKVLRATNNQADTLLRQRARDLLAVRKTIAQYSLKPNPYVNIDSLQNVSTRLEKQVGYVTGLIRQETRAYTWQEVRTSLKPAEAAVEIIRFNRWAFDRESYETDTVQYVALVIRPEWTTPHLVLLPNGAAMESAWAVAYGEEIEKPVAVRLAYQRYWELIARELTGVQKIFVAGDGIYHLISLPTLFNKHTNRFLLDEVQIVMLGSTRELVTPLKPTVADRSVLFGYPAYRVQRSQASPVASRKKDSKRTHQMRGDLSFNPLPATETEVREINQLLSHSHVPASVKIGAGASEPVLKAVVNPRILHIATHGFFHPDTLNQFYKINRLMACGLVLAGASDTTSRHQPDDEDGILTGYEASLLNLGQTELVTLSACQTGIGNSYASEGVFGLQRAFLLAGARSVLMSLWKVNDQLTKQFMIDFYRHWLSGMSKPQALRKAQQTLRSQYPNPYYWGAFVLLGQ